MLFWKGNQTNEGTEFRSSIQTQLTEESLTLANTTLLLDRERDLIDNAMTVRSTVVYAVSNEKIGLLSSNKEIIVFVQQRDETEPGSKLSAFRKNTDMRIENAANVFLYSPSTAPALLNVIHQQGDQFGNNGAPFPFDCIMRTLPIHSVSVEGTTIKLFVDVSVKYFDGSQRTFRSFEYIDLTLKTPLQNDSSYETEMVIWNTINVFQTSPELPSDELNIHQLVFEMAIRRGGDAQLSRFCISRFDGLLFPAV